jgi:catalase
MQVADGLGLGKMPAAAEPARAPITDLPPSPALSIVKNGPKSFKGRKLGLLVTDGVDAALLAGFETAAAEEGALVELIAPKVGGFTDSAGKTRPAQQKVNGGPSVLYDAVAILASAEGAKLLAREATAKDFVNDAFAHAKFIAYAATAKALLDAAGIAPDEGVVPVTNAKDAAGFIARCRELRLWSREPTVHAV